MSHPQASSRSVIAPADQSATFVELFFDLVFVFSVTQIVTLLHHELSWLVVGQAILVFWLVWWAWTQFTWALNAADTTHPLVELGTLLATAVAFFMAVTLPEAFHGHGLWFAMPYVLVRGIGLIMYIGVVWVDPSQRAAVRTFGLISISGLVAVILGGVWGGTAQYWLWGLAIGLDIVAAMLGGQADGWNIHPEHFGERHGLFVIIALGETLIIAAAGTSGTVWTSALIAVAVLAVAASCGLWWTYFANAKPLLNHALESNKGSAQSALARDVFSLLHFPMLCGVIAYAVVIEEAIVHPAEPMHLVTRLALALGLTLFVGGMNIAMWRANRTLLLPRLLILTVLVVLVIVVANVAPLVTLAMTFTGILLIAVVEQFTLVSPQ